jgi:hypothetical protein
MVFKNKRDILTWVFLFIAGINVIPMLSSCGKQGNASPAGLNIQYEVLNLSPDIFPVNLFVNFNQVNPQNDPFIYGINHGYFFVPSIALPFQIRTNAISGGTLLQRNDSLKSGLKYSLFITGQFGNKSDTTVFTVDTASIPAIGRGKIRLVNVSPTAISGLDLSANGTQAFSKVLYLKFSKFIELPVGNYDFQVSATGSTNVLKDMPGVTIQDGRLYTIYAYGYSTRIDTATFNVGIITNR